MEAAEKFSTELGTAVACRAFGVPRASLYRRRQRGADPAPPRPRAPSHRALGEAERGQVLDLLHSERFGVIVKSGVWKIDSSGGLIDVCHFDSIVEFHSSNHLGQIIEPS